MQPVAADKEVWRTVTVQVKGRSYSRAVSAQGTWCVSTQQDYVLGGRYARFQATAGMTDDSQETQPLTFYVLADTKQIKVIPSVGIGQPQMVDVSVRGVSRLAPGIEPPADSNPYDCPGPERVGVWSDPKLTS